MAANMRGLTIFVSDIRNCTSKDAEENRVAKELANIRAKFTGSKALSAYDRKKYVWKLVYVTMLGYDVEFGHVEVINLISSSTYQEKIVGYLAASVLLKNTDEQITLVVQSIRNDLTSPKDEVQCLALAAISNIGGPQLAEALVGDVARLLTGKATFPIVRKKAALTLLRLYRVNHALVPPEDWAPRMASLLDDPSLSVVMAVVTLMLGLCEQSAAGFEVCVPQVILTLMRLAVNNSCTTDYLYYQTANPWMQVKLLRLLQYFPPPSDATLKARLTEVLNKIISHTEVTKSVNKNNGDHSILFEAVNVVIHYGEESEPRLRDPAVKLLSRFISVREPNIRYLGLDTMARLAAIESTQEEIRKHQNTILFSLKDADVSIRKRALNLLFAMADRSNSMAVVKELLAYLPVAEHLIKEEMVLKIAILAERYAPDFRWYVDTLIEMITVAGDFVGDDIWHRAVQIVTNHTDLQKYAAHKLYEVVKKPDAHETAVKVGGYVLGEFGYWLNDEDAEADAEATLGADGKPESFPVVSGAEQLAALEQHFKRVAADTKALLLSSLIKFQNLYPELTEQVREVLGRYTAVMDCELQQRAVEYLAMPGIGEEAVGAVLDSMPPFPERASALEARLEKKTKGTEDRDRFGEEEKGAGDDDEDEEEEEESGSGESDGEPAEDAAAAAGGGGGGGGGGGAAGGGDDDDDLLGLSDSTPAPAPAPAPAAGGAAAGGGGGGGDDGPKVAVTRTIKLEPSQRDAVLGWFNALAAAAQGVLYEDSYIMIGWQYQVRPPEMRGALFIRNKSGGALRSLKVRTPPLPQLNVKYAESPPSTLETGGQAKTAVAVQCAQPFTEPPALQVSFVSGDGSTGHALALRLPVVSTHFCDPVPMGAADYVKRWGLLAGEPREAMVIIKASKPVAVEAAKAALTALRIGIVEVPPPEGAAPTPTVHGAASFRTASLGPTGAPISVGLLVRVDANAALNAYRLIVRAQHGSVAQGVKNAIVPQLGAPQA